MRVTWTAVWLGAVAAVSAVGAHPAICTLQHGDSAAVYWYRCDGPEDAESKKLSKQWGMESASFLCFMVRDGRLRGRDIVWIWDYRKRRTDLVQFAMRAEVYGPRVWMHDRMHDLWINSEGYFVRKGAPGYAARVGDDHLTLRMQDTGLPVGDKIFYRVRAASLPLALRKVERDVSLGRPIPPPVEQRRGVPGR